MNEIVQLNEAIHLLSTWIVKIELSTAIDFYDINRISENLAADLLNEIYGYNLKNLNTEVRNFPAVDLGDDNVKIAFQVTSTIDTQKIKTSLEKFVKYGLEQRFVNGIRFLFLSSKSVKLEKRQFASIYSAFNTERHIIKPQDLIQEIQTCYSEDRPKFERIVKILKGISDSASDTGLTYKFAVSTDLGLDPLDTREYLDEPHTWRTVRLMYRFFVRSSNFTWVEDSVIGIVFYSGDRLYTAESSLPDWIVNAIQFHEKPAHHRILHHSTPIRMINPSISVRTEWRHAHLSIAHSPWQAAVYILAKNISPVWYQFSIAKGEPILTPQAGSGVQVRDFTLLTVDTPIVSVGNQSLI